MVGAVDCVTQFVDRAEREYREHFARRLAEAFVKRPNPDWETTMEMVWDEELSMGDVA